MIEPKYWERKKGVQNGEIVLKGTRVTLKEIQEALRFKTVHEVVQDLKEAGVPIEEYMLAEGIPLDWEKEEPKGEKTN